MLAQAALSLLSSSGADASVPPLATEVDSLFASSAFGAAALAAFDPPPASALDPALFLGNDKEDFSYTYAQAGYTVTDLDELDDDAKGFAARGSLNLLHFFNLFVDYERQTTDFDDASADMYGLGVGAHLGLIPRLDFLAEVSWLYDKIDSDTIFDSDSDTGWMGYGGVRFMALPWEGGGLELDGGFRFIDIDSLLSDGTVSAWEVGARVHVLKLLSIGAAYTFLEDDHRIGVNVRVSF
jgi:hypothetical protein